MIATIVWVLTSVMFLAFLAIGSVPARIWRLGSLYAEKKSIAGIWIVQINTVPDPFPLWFTRSLFVGSMAIFVVGAILGMRFLLTRDIPDEA